MFTEKPAVSAAPAIQTTGLQGSVPNMQGSVPNTPNSMATPELNRPIAVNSPRAGWSAIAAMSLNRVIGSGNQLPWHLPDDLKWVMQQTRGCAIAMGRKTYASMGRPLPHRLNIVLTRDPQPIAGCTVLPSTDALRAFVCPTRLWIFGGATLYHQTLGEVEDFYLTLVNRTVSGDTFMPQFEHGFHPPVVVRAEPEFQILHYRHRALPSPLP
jgi:dihydrofolate reductase